MNINGLTKKEMEQRVKFHCKHGHNGFSHRLCFENSKGIKERVGFLDIETSSLYATEGMVYTYCIKSNDGKLIKRSVTLKDLYKGDFDKNLMKQFIEDAKGFDRFVLHYGENGRFDIPFLRTRAVYWNLDFPRYKTMYVSDTYPICKNQFRFKRNSLKMACQFLGIKAKGHVLSPKYWGFSMITGNPKIMQASLDWTMLHNIEDVLSTEALWNRINVYVAPGKKSI
jgi:uncharacterized protein YprB with RNaseH-like and TPR domain